MKLISRGDLEMEHFIAWEHSRQIDNIWWWCRIWRLEFSFTVWTGRKK